MNLNWQKCQGDVWCKLNHVNLDHSHFDELQGVYVIWHGGSPAETVYVGQGDIRNRLTEHRNNADIQQYSSSGLFVTWAQVVPRDRDGVERYLANTLNPLDGATHPNVEPIEVNKPWE